MPLPPGVDKDQIEILSEHRYQILEAKASISSMKQQTSKLIYRIIRMDQVRRPASAQNAPRLAPTVVFPGPPLVETTAATFIGLTSESKD